MPQIFTLEYYQRLAEVERQHPWSDHMQRLALALLERYGRRRPMTAVLDAGCGAGFFTALWQERGRIPMVVGMDASVDGLRISRGRGLKHLSAASVAALPFRDARFDAVYCADVLQHLDGQAAAQALVELARVVRRDGLLLIRTAARRGIGAKKHRDTGNYQQWEPEKLRRLLEPCGLRVEWMSRVNWLPSLAADLRAYGKPALAGDVGLHVAPASGGLRDRALAAYWRLEFAALVRLGWRLPGGHTLMCVARKL